MIQQTSLLAYREHQETLSRNEKVVYSVIKMCPLTGITNNEISEYLKWKINRVTGRTNGLVKKGRVKEVCKRPDLYTGNLSIAWGIA
jgi:helix-turn-helix protein